ncbi:translational GTPase TypA [Candidatus Gracilibacteria bacterium]|nr:translational GTPase TypA [Candidatus Gracilibacteria bacterium]MCF7896464.1 translational GTPase TypA [Candidatus Gracilibacteria bacterium]
MFEKIITLGVIAHVDHGKTTLVDALLKQGGAFAAHEAVGELMMDSNAQERERGITILSKNCAIHHGGVKINIVDTPGHADFSSEVERVLKICDTVLLLVDAQEGPMPQTRFVTQKALELGLKPIVVINKIDKPGANIAKTHDRIFDLFAELDATDAQLDFPMVLTIAKQGIAKLKDSDESENLEPLFNLIFEKAESRVDSAEKDLQALVYSLEYDNHLGRIGIARVIRGKLKKGAEIALVRRDGKIIKGRITKMFIFQGLKKVEATEAAAGEIVGVAGFPEIMIGETLADAQNPEALPIIEIGEPTVAMAFHVNTSPLAGREGKFVTTRQIRERLMRELETNVGLQVESIPDSDSYKVSGRGELHLAVLIENMRREGFELAAGRPEVILKNVDGHPSTGSGQGKLEPIEIAIVNLPDEFVGAVMEKMGKRKAELKNMKAEEGYTRLEFEIPTRGLIGYTSEFIRDTHGEGNLNHIFLKYDSWRGAIPARTNGVLVSQCDGISVGYSLSNLQERGTLFIGPQTEVYEGMIIGEASRPGDIIVNPLKGKKLSNVRSSGTDEALRLTPPRKLTLETAIEYVSEDELVEVTPSKIRLRKKLLDETARKRAK